MNAYWLLGAIKMEYTGLIGAVPVEKRESLANRLVDLALLSKNDDKMPSQLANNILHYWQKDVLFTESGLASLLEAAVLLEPDKTVEVFTQLELPNLAEQIKEAVSKP